MRYKLSPEWDITLPDYFQHRTEGEHAIFWTQGVTLLCTVFSYSGEKGRETLLANLRARADNHKLQTIEDIQGDIIRFGYLQTEELSPGHHRLALHAFTTAPFGCLQTSFYMDDPASLQDQLIIWNSTHYHLENTMPDTSDQL